MASKYSTDQFTADEIIVNKIFRHAGYSNEDLPTLLRAVRKGDIAVESMVENAISRVGKIARSNKVGEDFVDGSDAKKVTVVNQGTVKSPVRGAQFSTKNKTGLLRVVVCDPMTDQVYFFKIPPTFYVGRGRRSVSVRIAFNKTGGVPTFTNNNIQTQEVWSFRVNSFKELASTSLLG